MRLVPIAVGPDAKTVEGRIGRGFVTTTTRECDSDGIVGTLVVTFGPAGSAVVVTAAPLLSSSHPRR